MRAKERRDKNEARGAEGPFGFRSANKNSSQRFLDIHELELHGSAAFEWIAQLRLN